MKNLAHQIPLENIVSRQVELGHQIHSSHSGIATLVRAKPSLSISREAGSGVEEVVAELENILGWQVYDKNLVEQIAEDTKLNRSLVEALDEKTRGELQEWLMAIFQNTLIASDAYIRRLSKTILSIAKHGKAIIIGRGANFIIPKGQVLDVRIVAPLQHRIYYMADKMRISYEGAKQIVIDTDLKRKQFLNKFFNCDEVDALNYDLVINTGNMDYQSAAHIIIEALCSKFDSSLEDLQAED